MLKLGVLGLGLLTALAALVALPLLLAGLALRLALGLLCLPFRAVGLVLAATGALAGGLLVGLAGLAVGAVLVLALPLGILLILVLGVLACVKLVARAATA
jgi:hypothetical protein